MKDFYGVGRELCVTCVCQNTVGKEGLQMNVNHIVLSVDRDCSV